MYRPSVYGTKAGYRRTTNAHVAHTYTPTKRSRLLVGGKAFILKKKAPFIEHIQTTWRERVSQTAWRKGLTWPKLP